MGGKAPSWGVVPPPSPHVRHPCSGNKDGRGSILYEAASHIKWLLLSLSIMSTMPLSAVIFIIPCIAKLSQAKAPALLVGLVSHPRKFTA